ncbi:LacI family DNA-binding transcriptional regulator [Novosphingobium bradum]|uniref:LacI family DNA-binding transcriptional regulator n=1 Tax=Novosphingobium bradum TaxID=1737444 RepID=A0ABV7IRM2_9SPHN
MTSMKMGENGRRIRNISELAKLAGVSAGTVSRALAGKDLVNRQTRERIQALAREHGFRPNQMASRLRTGQTGVIGVVVPLGHERAQLLSDPFFMTLIGHLADAVTERGYDLMLSRVIPSDEDDWLERITDSGMLEGVLMIGQSDQFTTIERVARHYRPLVVWGTHRAGQHHCSVGTDSFVGGRLAAEHLLARGARHLAFFGETTGIEIAERLAGARAAVDRFGAGASLEAFPTRLAVDETAAQVAEHIDRMAPETDGIFAASDVIAMAVLRILRERGRKVPEEIAVIGYDDLPMAMQTVPRLTTVRQDIAAGARAMVDNLFARLRGEDAGPTVLEPRVIVRETA